MTSDKVRRAASTLGRAAGKGAGKRRGNAAYYAALRLSRPGTVTIGALRRAAGLLRHVSMAEMDAVALWLEREADRRERLNEKRARLREAPKRRLTRDVDHA